MNGVIETSTGDLLRAGFTDFTAGPGETLRFDVPNPPQRRGAFYEDGNMHRWTGSEWILVPQPMIYVPLGVSKSASVRQDYSAWVGNGQKIRQGSSWIWFGTTENNTGFGHDPVVKASGNATGTHSATTLQDTSKSWTTDQWVGYLVRIKSGTNADEVAKVVSNTSNTLTIDAAWITTVDNTSQYEISLAGRLVVPQAGFYLPTLRLTFNQSLDRLYGPMLYKNGVFHDSIFARGLTVETGIIYPGHPMFLEKDDYIEAKGYNGGPGDKPLLSFGARNKLSLTKIGA